MRFGAGGEDGAPDINDDYDGDDLGELDLTINVTNVDEDGAVTISPLQPQIGTLLRATLSDSDVQVGFGQWKWASSESGLPGTFTDLTAWVDENLNSNADTYRPVDDDLRQVPAGVGAIQGQGGRRNQDAQIGIRLYRCGRTL